MERVRLMTWCRNCVSGLHLPAFAAAEGGLFAEQELEVEFVGCVSAPERTLPGFAMRPKAVGSGHVDFALTSVAYALAAQTELDGRLGARFAAVSHQRNPIAAIVRDDSGLECPADLQGSRAARWSMPWFAQEYAGAMSYMGLDPSVIVDSPRPDAQLERGEIDVIPTWVDMTVNHVDKGYGVRPIGLDIETYSTGLLAADRLPLELVTRMRDAFVAGFELQLEQPQLGITAFQRRFPDISERHIRDSWSLFEPYAFDGDEPGAMHADRWETTIEHTAATHGLSPFAGERVYRPQLLAPAVEYAAA
ncbi:MAG: ABC transporter substrate-binding protein [Actinomycetota bacterium]|nr:ABC transporter substrate-binding protein [Actinomycetota bacterium]